MIYERGRALEEYKAECAQETVNFGGDFVLVWGLCISCEVVSLFANIVVRLKGQAYRSIVN